MREKVRMCAVNLSMGRTSFCIENAEIVPAFSCFKQCQKAIRSHDILPSSLHSILPVPFEYWSSTLTFKGQEQDVPTWVPPRGFELDSPSCLPAQLYDVSTSHVINGDTICPHLEVKLFSFPHFASCQVSPAVVFKPSFLSADHSLSWSGLSHFQPGFLVSMLAILCWSGLSKIQTSYCHHHPTLKSEWCSGILDRESLSWAWKILPCLLQSKSLGSTQVNTWMPAPSQDTDFPCPQTEYASPRSHTAFTTLTRKQLMTIRAYSCDSLFVY